MITELSFQTKFYYNKMQETKMDVEPYELSDDGIHLIYKAKKDYTAVSFDNTNLLPIFSRWRA